MNNFVYDIFYIIKEAGFMLADLIPYILIGTAVSSILIWKKEVLILRLLAKIPEILLVVISCILGMLSPVCTIATVPILIGLLQSGFPVSAGISFLIASSIITPQMVLIAVGTVGIKVVVLQISAVFFISIFAGFCVFIFKKYGIIFGQVPLNNNNNHNKTSIFMIFFKQLEFILIYIIIGVLAASFINTYLPKIVYYKFLSKSGILNVTLSALASMPLYTCGGSTFPVLGMLMKNGLSPGIVLAFIIAGPATRIQAITALSSILNKKIIPIYILFILIISIIAGVFTRIISNWI